MYAAYRSSRNLCCISKNYVHKIFESTILSDVQNCLAKRSYLSEAYKCNEKWRCRFQDEMIKDVKPMEYYYDLIKKYKTSKKISAIDADIFLNSVSHESVPNLSGEMEEILRLLRRSPETLHTYPSTTHAVVRVLMEAGDLDLIFKLLTDPMNYGVFLDFYTCQLFMDEFLKMGNYTAAARVASSLMLEEDFGSNLTKAFCLVSCSKYSLNAEDKNEPWIDYHPKQEPEEEVKVIVRYIRNPYFDDHFDLKDPRHIVGKTLAWLSPHLEEPHLKDHAKVLGWAMYEKWKDLVEALQSSKSLRTDILSKVSECVERCDDEEMKNGIIQLINKIKVISTESDARFEEEAEAYLKKSVEKYEGEAISNQEKKYEAWERERKEAVEKQLELLERNRLINEIEQKKEYLNKKEDVLFFFENKNKFELLLANKPRIYARKRPPFVKKRKTKAINVEYTPPEI